jgi:non-homologous end joining protein Ku
MTRTYQATPEAGGEKAFELLRRALMEESKKLQSAKLYLAHGTR